jgi:hypothetical protein
MKKYYYDNLLANQNITAFGNQKYIANFILLSFRFSNL